MVVKISNSMNQISTISRNYKHMTVCMNDIMSNNFMNKKTITIRGILARFSKQFLYICKICFINSEDPVTDRSKNGLTKKIKLHVYRGLANLKVSAKPLKTDFTYFRLLISKSAFSCNTNKL